MSFASGMIAKNAADYHSEAEFEIAIGSQDPQDRGRQESKLPRNISLGLTDYAQ